MLPFERCLLSSVSRPYLPESCHKQSKKKKSGGRRCSKVGDPHSFRRYLRITQWLVCSPPFDGTSTCISWRANSQCSRRSHEHSPSGASFFFFFLQTPPPPPSELYPRQEGSSQVKSDWGPSSTPNITPFTYPTSPVYTLPIYHQRQLCGRLSEQAGNINQAHLTENTGIRYQEPTSLRGCVWSKDLGMSWVNIACTE